MYYVLSTKILQRLDTASGTILQKRYCRICGLNPRLIYLNNIIILKYLRVSKNLYADNGTLFP